jgi:two-component system phosphate regulon sensor histidine kinase PhoR
MLLLNRNPQKKFKKTKIPLDESGNRYQKEVKVLRKQRLRLERQLKASLKDLSKTKESLRGAKFSCRRTSMALTKAQIGLEKKVRERTMQLEKEMDDKNRLMDRWSAIFENVEECIFFLDKNINIAQLNDAAQRFSGFSEKAAIGKKYYRIFKCKDAAGYSYPNFCPVEKVRITKEAIPYDEHTHTNASGTESWVGVSYTPIISKKGEVEQIVGVVRDITSLKEVERAKSDFVSIASHELRTPLTVINGYLSLFLSGDLGDSSSNIVRIHERQVLSKVFRETKRLTKLVEDLLNISRIEENRLKLNLTKEQFHEIVNEVIAEYNPRAESLGINLSVEINGKQNVFFVRVDKDKIKQVLVNLIDNALKFTKEGGKVVVRCSRDEGKLVTQIVDSGVGINKKLLPKIFEKFQQESGSFLKNNKGTGLGLFIVKSLVELHNGSIQVRSLPGKGTTFTFLLPSVD